MDPREQFLGRQTQVLSLLVHILQILVIDFRTQFLGRCFRHCKFLIALCRRLCVARRGGSGVNGLQKIKQITNAIKLQQRRSVITPPPVTSCKLTSLVKKIVPVCPQNLLILISFTHQVTICFTVITLGASKTPLRQIIDFESKDVGQIN